MKRSDIFIQVVYGWFSEYRWLRDLGSGGLVNLARRLRESGYTVNDTIMWNRPDSIAATLDQASLQKMRTVVIGFSLGANSVAETSHYAKRPIDLGVAYDPSQWYKGRMTVLPIMKKCIVYRAGFNFNPYGHAKLTGPTVETHTIDGVDHFRIPYREDLHQITLNAIDEFF